MKSKSKKIKTVDATPTWSSLVPLFIEFLSSNKPQVRAEGLRSLRQMAEICDAYVEQCKKPITAEQDSEIFKNNLTGNNALRLEWLKKNWYHNLQGKTLAETEKNILNYAIYTLYDDTLAKVNQGNEHEGKPEEKRIGGYSEI